jgi:hypothetical protein
VHPEEYVGVESDPQSTVRIQPGHKKVFPADKLKAER